MHVPDWTVLGSAAEAPAAGTMRAFPLDDGAVVAVARLDDGTLVAFDDECTHEECPLSEGDLEGRRVVCYCHNAAFDLETGAVMRGPAEDPLRIHALDLSEGMLRVRVDPGGEGAR